jgi:hypothetical protein
MKKSLSLIGMGLAFIGGGLAISDNPMWVYFTIGGLFISVLSTQLKN